MAATTLRELKLGSEGRPAVVFVYRSNSARDLRDAFVTLALEIRDRPADVHGVCLIVSSRLGVDRISSELTGLQSILTSSVANRLHWARADSTGAITGPLDLRDETVAAQLSAVLRSGSDIRKPAGQGARSIVLSMLVNDRIQASGGPARSLREWQQRCEVSYPTLTSLLVELRLRGLLDETAGKRGVRLRGLLGNELIDLAREFNLGRRVQLYVDPTRLTTGRRLLSRLLKLQQANRFDRSVRVGGVPAASFYFPQLDITGPPRLDLSSANAVDVRALDAALVPRSDRQPGGVVLAVHQVRHMPAALEEVLPSEPPWASCFESIADLLEVGFEREAREMADGICNGG